MFKNIQKLFREGAETAGKYISSTYGYLFQPEKGHWEPNILTVGMAPVILVGSLVLGGALAAGATSTVAAVSLFATGVVALPIAVVAGIGLVAGAMGLMVGLGKGLGKVNEPEAVKPSQSLMQQVESLSPNDCAQVFAKLQQKLGNAFATTAITPAATIDSPASGASAKPDSRLGM